MEIKLFEAANKKKSFTFSSLPEKISGNLGTKYQSYDIISQGAVKVLWTVQKKSCGCKE